MFTKIIECAFEQVLLDINEKLLVQDLPEGMYLRPDGDLVKPNGDTVGLSSSPYRLGRFFSRFQEKLHIKDISSWSVLDAGAFIGDAAAFFSTICRHVTAVERDTTIREFTDKRQKLLWSLGYAYPEKIRWIWSDYFSADVPFSGHMLVYNYFDQYHGDEEGHAVVVRIAEKFALQADPGAFLVFQISKDIGSVRGPLIYRADLSAGDFQVFEKDMTSGRDGPLTSP